MKNGIRFIIPYFGRWPFWMPFFVESCRYNPDIEWLFFTDCGALEHMPANITLEPISFADYCAMVGERLGISFRPKSPYKLCDIKPALGYIHADRLRDVEFWGFSDIDLIYGNLRHYFTDERLARFDLLSTHERRVSGHLCLLRNNERMRGAFRQVPGWRDSFENPEHEAFDEGDFSRLFIRRKNWPAPLQRLAGQLNPWRRKSEFVEAFSTPNGRIPWVDGTTDFPRRWIWSAGVLRNDRDTDLEFPYFHFIAWKGTEWQRCAASELIASDRLINQPAWSVTAQGFREA